MENPKANLFFSYISGEDISIISRCNKKIVRRFEGIGLFVAIIFSICLISVLWFMYCVFDGNLSLSLPIGIIWAFMVVIIYLLLLYTITPPILPVQRKKSFKKYVAAAYEDTKNTFTGSFIARIGFISVLSIIIAQPLNTLLFKKFADEKIENFKTVYRLGILFDAEKYHIAKEGVMLNDFLKHNQLNLYALDTNSTELKFLKQKIDFDQTFVLEVNKEQAELNRVNIVCKGEVRDRKKDSIIGIISALIEKEKQSDEYFLNVDRMNSTKGFEIFHQNLFDVVEAKVNSYKKNDYIINNSNFYIRRIILILSDDPWSWLSTILVIVIFLWPIWWKFMLRFKGDFYLRKSELEKEYINKRYEKFKDQYVTMLEENIKLYNKGCLERLAPLLTDLQKLSPDKYIELKNEIDIFYQPEKIIRYENWKNPPYNTEPLDSLEGLPEEKELFNLFYNKPAI
jgi:hypothetical protein